MNGWKPATKVTAFCMGSVVLAAVFCFCFSRHGQIEYPLPKPISKSCQVAEQIRSDEDDGMAVPRIQREAFMFRAHGIFGRIGRMKPLQIL